MDNNVLIAYYSWSGNTEQVAEKIRENIGGELFNIKPVNKYPDSYGACVEKAKKEINTGFLPELEAVPDKLDNYNTLFIGSPIWWYTMAPPVLSFLSKINLKGKKIIPFCTHGGGGKGHFPNDIIKSCPGSAVLDELVLYGGGAGRSDREISSWLKRIGIS